MLQSYPVLDAALHEYVHCLLLCSNTDPHLELGNCFTFFLSFKFLKKTKRHPQTCLNNDTCGEPASEDAGEQGIQGHSVLPRPQESITGGVIHLIASGNEGTSFLKDIINCCS